MRHRFMTLEDATLAGASVSDLGPDLELEADASDIERARWTLDSPDERSRRVHGRRSRQ
ncbi:hypothetical protein ACWC2K_31300 [Streptomyces chattanoogensis]